MYKGIILTKLVNKPLQYYEKFLKNTPFVVEKRKTVRILLYKRRGGECRRQMFAMKQPAIPVSLARKSEPPSFMIY